MNIEEKKSFVMSSKYRMRILHFLDLIGVARGYEIADMLLITQASTSRATKELVKCGLVDYVQYKQQKIFLLSKEGEKIAKELRDYYGTN